MIFHSDRGKLQKCPDMPAADIFLTGDHFSGKSYQIFLHQMLLTAESFPLKKYFWLRFFLIMYETLCKFLHLALDIILCLLKPQPCLCDMARCLSVHALCKQRQDLQADPVSRVLSLMVRLIRPPCDLTAPKCLPRSRFFWYLKLGRMMFSRTGRIPPSPRRPLPLARFIRIVSAWSSRLWATAILQFDLPLFFAACSKA